MPINWTTVEELRRKLTDNHEEIDSVIAEMLSVRPDLTKEKAELKARYDDLLEISREIHTALEEEFRGKGEGK